jgi:hypothetical protein
VYEKDIHYLDVLCIQFGKENVKKIGESYLIWDWVKETHGGRIPEYVK